MYSVALMVNFIYNIQLFKQGNILHSCRSVGPGLKKIRMDSLVQIFFIPGDTDLQLHSTLANLYLD